VLLGTTWTVFILGMGGVCGVWEWSLKPIRHETANEVSCLREIADGR
jgi:hypothetical protein